MKEDPIVENHPADMLPADSYRFVNREVALCSNSAQILGHFRFLYKRFFLGNGVAPASDAGEIKAQKYMMHIVDNLHSSNEFIIRDNFGTYRLSGNEGSCRYTYEDARIPSRMFEGFSDPLTLMSIALLRALSHLLEPCHLIHAGAVSWNNCGIIFPAPADRGKTTLVLKLLQKGFRFLSDEIACINPETFRLEPFPRAVNIRRESRLLLELEYGPSAVLQQPSDVTHTVDVEDIAPGSLGLSSEPQYLIFLKGIGEKPGLERISPSHALFDVMQFVLTTAGEPSTLLLKLAPVIDRLKCFNLVMGNIDATAGLITDLVSAASSKERRPEHGP